ncbi:hypothetical protein ARMGADRAFT_568782 [Armillaria gallica]|uniref:Uncharacterized protein n=1 Tax=Armillaria gallica TaxID=47427 RepID=A0A2H3EFB5_ARMGA|nr:hypothetical protein ARMGADRAFT_568782 [Armillaria gallica]
MCSSSRSLSKLGFVKLDVFTLCSILARASGSRHLLLVTVVGDGQSSPFFDLTLFPGIYLLMTTIPVVSLVGCSSLFCDSFPYFPSF